ncbi:unnamed protein product [Ostreobium quekettii]|uniref:BRO1 domain-containing protein n=1 Tax=Ostreobium quekettii TaxID=121088 RepID=A0A8S1J428_9CHLO|nr:unnamed protein product [Ostreobium quekettii]|eukprot:evm.model.scf_401.1 EVM.evm.TU.scf_401.1   scf_401:6947-12701(-)
MPMSCAASAFLAVHCKRGERCDLKGPILRYAKRVYGAQHAEDAASDLDEVQTLRNEVLAISSGGPNDTARDTLSRYCRALSVMETRFPISKDRDHAQVNFTWMEALQPRRKMRQPNIHFEKASVLFNLGAILSQQAAVNGMRTPEGCKEACSAFQEAAGVFQRVKDVALKIGTPQAVDLSAESLGLLEKLMLAQAQECVFLKASMDKKTAMVLAKVAKQTSVLYAETLSLFGQPLVKDYFERHWLGHVQLKSWMYDGLCQQKAAEHAAATEDMAGEISRLRQASALLHRAGKDSKTMSQDIQDSIKSAEDAVNTRLSRAEKDNAAVYLVKVQQFSELPPVEGALLVNSSPPTKLDASNEHLFASLVPESSAKGLSRYAELVDEIIHQETGKLESATDEARLKLTEWELPGLLDAIENIRGSTLPDGLRQELEEVERANGVTYLKEMSAQITALCQTGHEDLIKCETELDEEAKKDAELRKQYGDKWKPPASASLTTHFRKLLTTYRSNLSAASHSDKVVLEKLAVNATTFGSLTVGTAAARMPRLVAPIVNLAGVDPTTVVMKLRTCLEQLNSVSAERAGLEDALKERKTKDNILPKLLSSAGSQDDLFHNELKKYDDLKADVKDNLEKQAQLLTDIGSANVSFRETFNVPVWKNQCQIAAKEIKDEIRLFYEVRDNLGEGMRFYMSLQDAVRTMLQQTSDFCMTRRMQRDEYLQSVSSQRSPRGGGMFGIFKGMRDQMFPRPSPAPAVQQPPQQMQNADLHPETSGRSDPPSQSQHQALPLYPSLQGLERSQELHLHNQT